MLTIKLSAALALLSACGILLAAGLTAYLTLTFGKHIQDDLEYSRDHGLELCFEKGKENAMELSQMVVEAGAAMLQRDLSALLLKPYIVCEGLTRFFDSKPVDRAYFNDAIRDLQHSTMLSNVKTGLTEISILFSQSGTFDYYLSYEQPSTRGNTPFEPHIVSGAETINQNTSSLWNIPFGAGLEVYYQTYPTSTGHLTLDSKIRVNGDALGRPIPTWLEKYAEFGTGGIIWAPLEDDKQGLNAMSVFYVKREDPSVPLVDGDWSLITVGIDLHALSVYIGQIGFQSERRYIVYENPWVEGKWQMLASSTGKKNSENYDEMTNLDDAVIAGHVAHSIEGGGYDVTLREYDDQWTFDGRTYWVNASRVDTLGGVNMGIILLVPQDEALLTILNATAQVEAKIDAENDDVNEKQDLLLKTYIPAILIPSLVLMILGFMWFSYKITKPLARLSRDMTEVGSMNLSSINPEIEKSSIEEVLCMQGAFKQMYDSIVEYRNYLPHSMLDQLAVSSEEEEKSEASGRYRTRNSRHSAAMSGSSLGSSVYTDYTAVTGATGVSSGGGAAVLQDQFLRKRRITLIATNFCDWHNRFDTESEMADCINGILPHILRVVSQHQGTPDGFTGDRVTCSFNAVRPLSSHCVAGCRVVQGIQAACREMKEGGVPLRLTAGIVSGQVLLGNVGCEGMKKFSIYGTRVTTVYALERYARHANATTAVANSAFKEAETAFYFRILDNVLFTKANPLPTPVYELCQERTSHGPDNEWMYQLQDGATSDPYHCWNLAYQAIMNSPPDWSAAEALIDAISKIPHEEGLYHSQQDTPKNKLVNTIRGREYSPVTITFH